MFGLVDAYSQAVSPAKTGALANDPMPVKLLVRPTATRAIGSFIVPVAGIYTFILHGPGMPGTDVTGGAGGMAVRTVRLPKGAALAYVVGSRDTISPLKPYDSTLVFADRTMTAGAGFYDPVPDGPVGGKASGGDYNQNGIVGAQAPSYGPFLGGTPGLSGMDGPGGPGTPSNTTQGPGQLVAIFIGP